MSLIAWLLESTGSFDKLRKGRYDEGSACGFVQECQDTKDCINRICTPNNAAYGGQFFDDCINYCNYDPTAQDVSDFLCNNPQEAFNLYGYECEGAEIKKAGFIRIFGKDIKIINIASLVILLIIFYVIFFKKK